MKYFLLDLLVEVCTLLLLGLFGGWAYSIVCAIDDEATKRQALIDSTLKEN